MAGGWFNDENVHLQIDNTVEDIIRFARSKISSGPSNHNCEECDTVIPEGRRIAVPGVTLCVVCQHTADVKFKQLYNRRGSLDSQIR